MRSRKRAIMERPPARRARPLLRVEYGEAIPLSGQGGGGGAKGGATTNIDAFMLWITPLRDAPPDNCLT